MKNHLSAYLERVRRGEEIIITDRGRPVARHTSLEPAVDRMQELVDRGLITPATAPRSLPEHRIQVRDSLADLVADQRR